MSTVSVLKARGLFTADNPYGARPEGALTTADNVVIRNKDVIEPRRGGNYMTYGFGSTSDRAASFHYYGSTLIVHYGTTSLAYDTGSAFTAYSGSHTAPDATLLRMKSAHESSHVHDRYAPRGGRP